MDIIQNEILAGTTYEQYHAHQVKLLNGMPEEDRLIYEDPEEEYFISEADYNRIGREALEEKRVPSNINHAEVTNEIEDEEEEEDKRLNRKSPSQLMFQARIHFQQFFHTILLYVQIRSLNA